MQANIKGTQYCPLPVAKKIRLLKGPLKKWTEPYMKFQKGSKKLFFFQPITGSSRDILGTYSNFALVSLIVFFCLIPCSNLNSVVF